MIKAYIIILKYHDSIFKLGLFFNFELKELSSFSESLSFFLFPILVLNLRLGFSSTSTSSFSSTDVFSSSFETELIVPNCPSKLALSKIA